MLHCPGYLQTHLVLLLHPQCIPSPCTSTWVHQSVFFRTPCGHRRPFLGFCSSKKIVSAESGLFVTSFSVSSSGNERGQPPTPYALDLCKITSSGYQAFLVQVMAPPKNEKSHLRSSRSYFKALSLFLKDHLIFTLGISPSFSYSKEKTDLVFTLEV